MKLSRAVALEGANILLSGILATTPNFTSFNELIPATTPSLLLHEVFILNKVIDDIHKYLQEVLGVFASIGIAHEELNWYYEGKDQVIDLYQNVESIESTISRLLNIIDGSIEDFKISTSLMLSKFEDASNILMEVKKYVIVYKKKVDIANNYKEIKENIMKSLSYEIDSCLNLASKLLERKSSSTRDLPKLNLDKITSKMKINDLTQSQWVKSIRLPTFNDHDESVYTEYLSLEDRINPLGISLNILPLKIEEFDAMCSGKLFPRERFEVLTAYDKLSEVWHSLQKILKVLKKECVDAKWNEIFKYLITENVLKCNTMIQNLESVQDKDAYITDDIGSMYKSCSNMISIIGKAFRENLITDPNLIPMFSDKLSTRWQLANDMLARFTEKKNSTPPQINKEMQAFQTISRSVTPELIRDHSSLGLDLGVNVNTSNVPYSIQKKDKVQDFFNPSTTALEPRRRGLRFSLQSLNDLETMVEDDDASTLVTPKTPKFGFGQDRFLITMSSFTHSKDNDFDVTLFLSTLATTKPLKPTRIPMIQSNYFERGLPITKKKYLDKTPSRLPSISPNHPVFNSPDRKRESNNNHVSLIGKLGSPIKSPGVTTHKRILSPFDLVSNKRPTSLLRDIRIPDLAHKNTIQVYYNSTSPERPCSSMGSRFDEAHLIQSSRW